MRQEFAAHRGSLQHTCLSRHRLWPHMLAAHALVGRMEGHRASMVGSVEIRVQFGHNGFGRMGGPPCIQFHNVRSKVCPNHPRKVRRLVCWLCLAGLARQGRNFEAAS